ncbi:pyrimidine dimer DNA glycosylase/endonuclease V [Myxococcota bacterium]
MRLWTLHPRYLDTKGLLALWREALLAQAVLLGNTRGYTRHPQLERFRQEQDPLAAIGAYLSEVHAEGCRRGYCFDASKIISHGDKVRISVTQGQLSFEWDHLLDKLVFRDPVRFGMFRKVGEPDLHPVFSLTEGHKEPWERGGRS